MKKSKLFLTASLVVMTIAAVASTKGLKKTTSDFYYYKGTACVHVTTATIPCTNAGTDCLYLDPATSVNYPAYLDLTCATRLGRD